MSTKDKYDWFVGMEVVVFLGDYRFDHGSITKMTNTQVTAELADSCPLRFSRNTGKERVCYHPRYLKPLAPQDREYFKKRELELAMKRATPEDLTTNQLERIVAIINEGAPHKEQNDIWEIMKNPLIWWPT